MCLQRHVPKVQRLCSDTNSNSKGLQTALMQPLKASLRTLKGAHLSTRVPLPSRPHSPTPQLQRPPLLVSFGILTPLVNSRLGELTVRQTGKMWNVVACFVTTIILPALLVTDINDPAMLVAAVLVGANRASRSDCTSPGMRWLGSAMLLRAAALAAALEATTVLNSGQGRPAVGQVLYTWGLNDRRQLGASSCVRDRVLNIFQCRADSANRQRPSSVDTLNYTNISHISMSRDTTFVRQQTGGEQRWLSWGDRQRIGRPLADEAQDDGSFLKVNMSGTPVEVEGLRRAAHVAAAYRCGCQWDVSIILSF